MSVTDINSEKPKPSLAAKITVAFSFGLLALTIVAAIALSQVEVEPKNCLSVDRYLKANIVAAVEDWDKDKIDFQHFQMSRLQNDTERIFVSALILDRVNVKTIGIGTWGVRYRGQGGGLYVAYSPFAAKVSTFPNASEFKIKFNTRDEAFRNSIRCVQWQLDHAQK